MRISTDAKLTKRENEVLHFLTRGCTRSQIAKKLFISDETVKMHIKNIYRKLKAKNKIDALIKMKMI
jgi:LuxR family transcriptional regulator of csgAB operon